MPNDVIGSNKAIIKAWNMHWEYSICELSGGIYLGYVSGINAADRSSILDDGRHVTANLLAYLVLQSSEHSVNAAIAEESTREDDKYDKYDKYRPLICTTSIQYKRLRLQTLHTPERDVLIERR